MLAIQETMMLRVSDQMEATKAAKPEIVTASISEPRCEPDQKRRDAEAFYGGLVQMMNAWRRLHLPEVKGCPKCGK